MVATLAKEKQDSTGFGARLRALRNAAGMTQQQLADKLEMRATNITRLENGGRSPTWETVIKIADALGVEPNDFLPQDG